MKKKLLPLCAALICICALSISLVACNPNDNQDNLATSFVSLDINPSIEITLDKNDKVVSVYGANEDAQVLLYGEDGIIGMNIENAVDKITKLAVELGYLNEDNKVVQTSVSGSVDTEKLQGKIDAQITATAANLNMTVSCENIDAYSLMRQLEKVKAQFPDNEKIQELTPAEFKLVVSATEAGNISIEAAVELDEEKLIQLVSETHTKVEQFATDAYNKAITLANDAYDKAYGAVVDGVYAQYYLTNILSHPTTAYYGVTYEAYKMSARGLNAVADALCFVENVCDTPLDKEQIAAISEALGLGDDVSALENANGEITVKSVEAYADKLFKNSQASAELDQIKADLTAAINETESKVQEVINEKSKEYEEQINAAMTAFESAKEYLENFANQYIPEAVKEQINVIIADFTEITSSVADMLEDGKITSDEVRTLATLLNSKANTALDKINADLSEEELNTINESIAQKQAKLDNIKSELDQARKQAEEQAKQYLANLKAQRQPK